jgi:hypothetical protein
MGVDIQIWQFWYIAQHVRGMNTIVNSSFKLGPVKPF